MKIITDPEKLRVKCRPIAKDTNMKKIYTQVDQALHLMFDNNGVGLAANQIGSDRQWLIALIKDEKGESTARVFFNPVITSHSESTNDDVEGCLSFPNKFGTVTRWDEISLRYLYHGKSRIETFTGYNARVIQHEVDHLTGILCMDKARDVYMHEPGAIEEEGDKNGDETEAAVHDNLAVES